MNEILYVKLVRIENGEVWFFKETQQGYKPHRKLKDMIEGEIIEDKVEVIVS